LPHQLNGKWIGGGTIKRAQAGRINFMVWQAFTHQPFCHRTATNIANAKKQDIAYHVTSPVWWQ
jgi:hypothetical protein